MTSARRPPAARGRALAVALGLLALVPAGCGGGDDPAPAPSGPRRGRYDASGRLVEGTRRVTALPNVVVVVLDTLRADALTGRAGGPSRMPRLAAWAQGATRFADASSCAAWTAPSVATLLTGLLPSSHGVQGHIAASPLSPSVVTLPEILQQAGYTTVAFTGGGWVSREMGMSQGFEQFVEGWSTADPRKGLRRALAELDRERPCFVLLHTYEAHDPYGRKEPPEGHDDPARVAATDAAVARFAAVTADRPDRLTHDEGRELLLGWRSDPLFRTTYSNRLTRDRAAPAVLWYTWSGHPTDPRRAEVEATLRARYERGLGLLDDGLAGTLAALDAAELPGRTVTVVVSDHGEAFGEAGALGHGRWLCDPITRAVLLLRAPGRANAGVVPGSCSLADVVPTLLDLCGLPVPLDAPGRSLLPLARGEAAGAPAIAEEFQRRPLETSLDGKQVMLRLRSVRTAEAKFLLTWDPRDDAVTEEVFDLTLDPAETTPRPPTDLARFGAAFVAAVERVRAEARTFATRPDSHGEGKFHGE